MKDFLISGVVFAIIAAVILSPFLLVWALNTLFKLAIDYTFSTWLASLVLILTVNNVVRIR